MKVGLALPLYAVTGSGARPLGFAEVLAHAHRAEALGFDSLWVSDHLFIEGPGGARTGTLEAWTLLSALAARTERVQLGSLVLCNSFRHPALLAKMAASLHDVSGGRLVLGLGTGWHEPEYQAAGLPFDHRAGRLEESVTALTQLLRHGESSYRGRYVQLDRATLVPPLESPPPVWIAGSGARMLRITARLADGVNVAWFGRDLERFRQLVARIRRTEEEVERTASPLLLSAGLQMTPLAAGVSLDEVREQIASVAPQTRGRSLEELRRSTYLGSAAECAAVLRDYAEAGADHVIVSLAPRPFALLQHDGIDRFAREVLPAVR